MRVGRIVAVTAGLAATGAVLGAGLGGLVGAAGLALGGGGALFHAWRFLLFASGAGAVIGAVLAPVAAWALLRYVPLGRAVGQTLLGSALGAAIGMAITPFYAIYGSLIGFVAAAVRLRLVTPARPALPSSDHLDAG